MQLFHEQHSRQVETHMHPHTAACVFELVAGMLTYFFFFFLYLFEQKVRAQCTVCTKP